MRATSPSISYDGVRGHTRVRIAYAQAAAVAAANEPLAGTPSGRNQASHLAAARAWLDHPGEHTRQEALASLHAAGAERRPTNPSEALARAAVQGAARGSVPADQAIGCTLTAIAELGADTWAQAVLDEVAGRGNPRTLLELLDGGVRLTDAIAAASLIA